MYLEVGFARKKHGAGIGGKVPGINQSRAGIDGHHGMVVEQQLARFTVGHRQLYEVVAARPCQEVFFGDIIGGAGRKGYQYRCRCSSEQEALPLRALLGGRDIADGFAQALQVG